MLRGDVFDLHRTGPRTFNEAQEIVQVLRRTTPRHAKDVNDRIARLEAIGPKDKEKTTVIEHEISEIIADWNDQVRKLGAIPKGLWLVDIDSGDGYYCWKHPEQELGYWHDYRSGFTGRISLAERYAGSSSTNQLSPR